MGWLDALPATTPSPDPGSRIHGCNADRPASAGHDGEQTLVLRLRADRHADPLRQAVALDRAHDHARPLQFLEDRVAIRTVRGFGYRLERVKERRDGAD